MKRAFGQRRELSPASPGSVGGVAHAEHILER